MMKKIILCLLINLCFSSLAYADSLTATVNRNPIPVGETFVLSLSYQGDPQGAQPDLKPIQDKFRIYSNSQSYKSQYANGKFSKTIQWNLVLAAGEIGEYIIPAVEIGNQKSKPIKIKVVAAEDVGNADSPQARFSAKRTISNSHPFVQQQLNYTFTISSTENLQGEQPQFLATNDDWIIRALGDPIISNRIKNGIEIKDYTFNYAMFPQRSGDLVIPKLQFDGSYVDENAYGGAEFDTMVNAFRGLQDVGFGMQPFGVRRPVSLSSAPISIKVAAIPSENNGNWWLPAKKAVLTSDWQKELPEFKSGEAVNRTIYLKVVGVVDTQMPKIKFKDIDGVKQYPEKPEIESRIEGEDVVSIMKINTVYIPEKSGIITIPEVAVYWYNVNTDKQEKTVLPAQKIRVKQGIIKAEAQAPILTQTPVQQALEPSRDVVQPQAQTPLWQYIIMAFVLGALLAGAVAWATVKYMLKTPSAKGTEEKTKKVSVAKAVRENDLRSIRDNVLNWARKQYPETEIKNFDDVAVKVNNPEFTAQLRLLQKAIYGGSAEDFNPIKFMDIFARISKQQKAKAKSQTKLLPDLYQK